MNRQEILDELYPLKSEMLLKHKRNRLIMTLNGNKLIFKFIPAGHDEELIAVTVDNITMFADYIKLRKDSIFLEQNGGIFVARIGVL